MQVHSHTYYSIYFEAKPQVLRFSWADGHQDMSYSEFQEACSNFAGYAHEYQSLKLLVDVRNFTLSLPDEFSEWQEKVHYPRFYKLGVQKMAYLTLPEWMQYMEDIPAQAGKFALKNFGSEAEARTWLLRD